MDPTKIAVAQLAIAVAEPDANRQAAAAAIAEAAAAGARLVVLPELSDSGYVFAPQDPAAEARGLAAPAAGNPALDQWHALAVQHGLVIVGGFCELGDDGLVYNSAALVDASGTRAVYRKAHLWDKEKFVFTPGDAAPPVVDTEAGRVAVMVCYDLEFPEWTRLAALEGADVITAPVNWPGYRWPEGERPAEVVKAQAAAASNGVFVAVCDRCGVERGVPWISGSLIASPEGYLLAGPVLADRPAVLTADCDLPRARNKRVSENNDLLADRRPELYARLSATLAGQQRSLSGGVHLGRSACTQAVRYKGAVTVRPPAPGPIAGATALPAGFAHPHASEEARRIAEAGLILRVQGGSGLHGIAIDGQDDRDELGLCLEPPPFVTGLARVPAGIRGESPSVRFEQYERHTAWDRPGGVANRSGAGDLDVVIYSARKWARLALAGNPTVLLVLFVPDEEVVFRNEAGAELAANAHRFVSRLAAARYLGYLTGQKAAMTGQSGAHTNRPELVAIHGYDTKYAMHALRLGLQGIELLTTGSITLPVPGPHREYLRSIRRGERTLAEVLDAISETEARLARLRDSAAVPDQPDRRWVDGWLHRSYLDFWASLP